MNYTFSTQQQPAEIRDLLYREKGNPLVQDLLRILNYWQSDFTIGRALSFAYDLRVSIGTMQLSIGYGHNNTTSTAIIYIGKYCLANDIYEAKVCLSFSQNTGYTSLKLILVGDNPLASVRIQNIIYQMRFKGGFYLDPTHQNVIELSIPMFNLDILLNLIYSIRSSSDNNTIHVENRIWG